MATLTKQELGQQLLRYFDGDRTRVKLLADGCKEIGFPLGDNLEAISKNPAEFMLLITYSDLGVLPKLTEVLKKLKGK